MMKKFLAVVVMVLFTFSVKAQCAMCRATLENNLSDGELEVGSSINNGILYLFVMPYLTIGLVAFFWYRNSRLNVAK